MSGGVGLSKASRASVQAIRLHPLFPSPCPRPPRLTSLPHLPHAERGDNSKGCGPDEPLFNCLLTQFDPGCTNSNYSTPLEGWLKTFLPEQIHVIQFEELQEDTDGVLRSLKSFLGMDPELPKKQLRNTNDRKAAGMPMKREEYEKLLALARPDAERTASLLAHFVGKDRLKWMARWEAVWDAMLATCDDNGNCLVDSN